jgi:hypothetical protein
MNSPWAASLAWLFPLLGCGREGPAPGTGDPVCSGVEVGGDACTGFWPYGVTVPPDPRFRVDGSPAAEVGRVREWETCTCVEPRLDEACAALGFPDGCPSPAELAGDGFVEAWTALWYCAAQDDYYVFERKTYSDVCYGDDADTDTFGAVEYVWFSGGEVVAIELVAVPGDDGWCCNGTLAGRRWLGAPIPVAECVPLDLPCGYAD